MAVIEINSDTGDDTTGDGSEGSPYETYTKFVTEGSASDTCKFQEATAGYPITTHTCPVGSTMKADNLGDATLTGTAARWEGEGTMTIQKLIFTGMNTQTSFNNLWGLFSFNLNSNAVTWNISDCKILDYTTSSSFEEMAIFNPYVNVGGTDAGGTATTSVFNLTRVLVDVDGTGGIYGGRANANANTIVATNCTFYMSSVSGAFRVHSVTGNTAGTITDKNCIYSSTVASTIFEDSNGITTTSSYSNYYNIGTGRPSGTGVITSDPLFLDAPNDNFSLRPSSLALGMGTIT